MFSHVSDANASQHIGMPGLTGHLIISYVVKYIVTVCFVKLLVTANSHLIGFYPAFLLSVMISSEMILNICYSHSNWSRSLLIVVFFQLKIQTELSSHCTVMSSDDLDFCTFNAALYFEK